MTEDRQRTDKELWNKGSKCIFQTSPCILIITYGRGWSGEGRGDYFLLRRDVALEGMKHDHTEEFKARI